jgi:tetratricopeptide (TPR) repeat protein
MIESPVTEPGLDRAAEYERLRGTAVDALEAGHLQTAADSFRTAVAVAAGLASDVEDRALCNYASVAIALGDPDAPLQSLRQVLLRTSSLEVEFLAAIALSRAHDARKEATKALFYGRLAKARAEALGDAERLASALNRLANALVADSAFAEAATSYRQALALVPGGEVEDLGGLFTANLAYCEVVTGETRTGMRRLFHLLRNARQRSSRRLEMIARIDLCFAYLELERHAEAERHGLRGLALAEEVGEVDWIKNGLYLLGEAAVLSGHEDIARERFAMLQSRFYPSQTYLPELLITVDVRKLVNLRA